MADPIPMNAPLSAGSRFVLALPDGLMSGLRFGRETGSPDLVFLHATGFNAETYAPLLGPLADRFSLLALDLRGHGLTRLPTEPAHLISWQPYADDVVKAIDLLVPDGARPIVLAGHSMGGIVALLAAGARPAKVRGLLLLDPVLMPHLMRLSLYTAWGRAKARAFGLAVGAAKRRAVFPSKEEAVANYRTRSAFKTWQPGFLESYVEGGFVPDPEGVRLACAPSWESATFAAHRHNAWRVLKRLAMPVRLLAAGHGSTVKGGIATVNRVAPKVQAASVEGTTHFFPMEKPAVVRDALVDLLTRS
jgi:pimeloyl-ACP methyl ester carboxylesterase